MDNNPVTPPSMIGAGVTQPQAQPTEANMVDMLKDVTQPAPPSSILPQAPGLPQIQPMQANPGLGFGSGVLSALGGHPAVNPYLTQMQQADAHQQARNVEMMQMQQRAQNMKFEREMHSTNALRQVADKLLGSEDRNARLKGAEVYGSIAKKMGFDLSPDVLSGLAQGKLTKDQMAHVIGLYDMGLPPEQVARQADLPIQKALELKTIADNDPSRKLMGLPTRVEGRLKDLEDKKKSIELTAETYGLTAKNPQTPFALQYTLEHFGKNFNEASHEQRLKAITASKVLATKEDKPTSEMRNAMAEFLPNGDPNNPDDVRKAMALKRAQVQRDMLQRAGTQNQLSVIGQNYAKALDRVAQQTTKMDAIDTLVAKMDRLLDEGQALGLMGNGRAINTVQNELLNWTGGPKSKGAQWLEAMHTLDGQFAAVAQGIENITGNRFSNNQMARALSFHPKPNLPVGTNRRIVQELKQAAASTRSQIATEAAQMNRQYSSAAGAAGVPFILGNPAGHGEGAWGAEEEK